MNSRYTLRLKDIENISNEDVDYKIIMREVLGFKNKYFLRKYIFAKKFKEALYLVKEAQGVNPTLVVRSELTSIKVPYNIDNISFRAMLELRTTLHNYDGVSDFGEHCSKVIAIACYSSNFDDDYNSLCKGFIEFENKILISPIWEMVGIYNWINKQLDESDETWNKRFLSVELEDPDYISAGGNRMDQFNVNTTIKTLCKSYNVTYKEAWQLPYVLSQTNSYSMATYNHIQDQMRIIKENKMRIEKDRKKYS